MLQHLGHAEFRVLGMAHLTPQRPATLAQPRIEFGERAKALVLRLQPDAATTVLHVLLDDAFLPARGDVAEVGIEQVVRAHHRKARIDDPALALLDLVDRRLHVVVDAAPGNAAQRREGARVGIEQHLVALARIGHQPERAAGAQLQVRHLHAPVDAADHQPLFAPVELERFAQCERQRHEGVRRLAFAPTPVADEVGDAGCSRRRSRRL